jgi:hypothetical protein
MPSLSGVLNKTPVGYAPVLLLVLLAGLAVARFLPTAFAPDPPPLLQPHRGLVETTTIAAFSQGAGRSVTLPEFPSGVTSAALGIYTQPTEQFPANTVAIVLTKDGWRYAEILDRPGTDMPAVMNAYPFTSSRPITIAPEVEGSLLLLEAVAPVCIEGRNGKPGSCLINRVLVFPSPHGVVTIATDAHGATEGELFDLARRLQATYTPTETL